MTWEELKEKYRRLGDFKTDGCTAAPDLFWKDCCKAHDFYYRNSQIGTGVSRKEADKRLRHCMRAKGSGRFVAWVYWAAVRIVGRRFWKT